MQSIAPGSSRDASRAPPGSEHQPQRHLPPRPELSLDTSQHETLLQPSLNVGLIGHVAHGKSTLARALSGLNTMRHASEQKSNMTIKLGYTNVKIFRCDNPLCPKPQCYQPLGALLALTREREFEHGEPGDEVNQPASQASAGPDSRHDEREPEPGPAPDATAEEGVPQVSNVMPHRAAVPKKAKKQGQAATGNAKRRQGAGKFSRDSATFPCPRRGCGGVMRLALHISLVDSPGHEVLMTTMLSGAAVMDAAILVVSAAEPCPQPQTAEHLAAASITGLLAGGGQRAPGGKLLVVQNKVDLLSESSALSHWQQMNAFLDSAVSKSSPSSSVEHRIPIVPMSAHLGINIDALCQLICERLAPACARTRARPVLDSPAVGLSPPSGEPLEMLLIRSFDVNKPGAAPTELQGGVVGGSVVRGSFGVGQQVEIRPGICVRRDTGQSRGDDGSGADQWAVMPLRTQVRSLSTEQTSLREAHCGGLIGVGLSLDPSLTRQDRLVGQVLCGVDGPPDALPEVFVQAELEFAMMKRAVGAARPTQSRKGNAAATNAAATVADEADDADEEQAGSPLASSAQAVEGAHSRELRRQCHAPLKREQLLFHVGARAVTATVTAVKANRMRVVFERPVCEHVGRRIAIARRVDKRFRLVGAATLTKTVPLPLVY